MRELLGEVRLVGGERRGRFRAVDPERLPRHAGRVVVEADAEEAHRPVPHRARLQAVRAARDRDLAPGPGAGRPGGGDAPATLPVDEDIEAPAAWLRQIGNLEVIGIRRELRAEHRAPRAPLEGDPRRAEKAPGRRPQHRVEADPPRDELAGLELPEVRRPERDEAAPAVTEPPREPGARHAHAVVARGMGVAELHDAHVGPGAPSLERSQALEERRQPRGVLEMAFRRVARRLLRNARRARGPRRLRLARCTRRGLRDARARMQHRRGDQQTADRQTREESTALHAMATVTSPPAIGE